MHIFPIDRQALLDDSELVIKMLSISAVMMTLIMAPLINAPLWHDEAGTLLMARLPSLEAVLAAAAGDVHPPLYFVLVWLHHQLNPELLALHGVSVIAYGFSFLAVRRIAEALEFDETLTWSSIALWGLSAFQIYYGGEARPYMLLQMFWLWAVVNALGGRWWWMSLCCLGMVYTHVYGWLYLLVVLFVVREAWKVWLWPLVTYLLVYVPWLPVQWAQVGTVSTGYWLTFNFARDIPITLFSFFGYGLPSVILPVMFLAYTALVGAALVFAYRRNDAVSNILLALIGGPLLLAALISIVRPIWLTRALIGVSAPLCLLLVWCVSKLRRTATIDLIIVAMVMAIFGVVGSYTARIEKTERWAQSAIAHLPTLPGDVVYHTAQPSYVEAAQDENFSQHWLAPLTESGGIGDHIPPAARRAMLMQERALDDLTWDRAWVVVPQTAEGRAIAADVLAHHPNRFIASYPDPHGVGGVEIYLIWASHSAN